MSEITEMVLDGILCESCGTVIDMKETGYPRKCEDCEESEEYAN